MQNKSIYSCVSFNTTFGWLTINSTPNGIREIKFGKFCRRCKGGVTPPLLKELKQDVLDYLAGKKNTFDYHLLADTSHLQRNGYPLDVSFTLAQSKVFNELKKIAYGTTISYKELAKRARTSPRACGRILATNPFPIIIPCHRVIRATGEIGGFSGGLHWKMVLLKLEGVMNPLMADIRNPTAPKFLSQCFSPKPSYK